MLLVVEETWNGQRRHLQLLQQIKNGRMRKEKFWDLVIFRPVIIKCCVESMDLRFRNRSRRFVRSFWLHIVQIMYFEMWDCTENFLENQFFLKPVLVIGIVKNSDISINEYTVSEFVLFNVKNPVLVSNLWKLYKIIFRFETSGSTISSTMRLSTICTSSFELMRRPVMHHFCEWYYDLRDETKFFLSSEII